MSRARKWWLAIGIGAVALTLIAVSLLDDVRQARSKMALRDLGGFVYDESQLMVHSVERPTPAWLAHWLGDSPFADVLEVNLIHEYRDGRFQTASIGGVDCLDHIANFPRLEKLHLHKTQITDDGLRVLRSLPALREVYLHDATGLTDAGIGHVLSRRGLTCLVISSPSTSATGFADLARVPGLRTLSIQGAAFDDRTLEHIAALESLEELYLGHGPIAITDEGLEPLHRLQNLRVLELRGAPITDEGLKQLVPLPLTHLCLAGTRVTKRGRLRLQQLKPDLLIY